MSLSWWESHHDSRISLSLWLIHYLCINSSTISLSDSYSTRIVPLGYSSNVSDVFNGPILPLLSLSEIAYRANPIGWGNPGRNLLYSIPLSSDHATWVKVQHVCTREEGGTVRILSSHSTAGTIVYAVSDNGLACVGDITLLPDFLMLNFVQYFLTHPRVNEIWVETTDTDADDDSSARSDPASVYTVGSAASTNNNDEEGEQDEAGDEGEAAPNYALVIRRRTLNYLTASSLRALQAQFFINHHTPYPDPRAFVDTLHGR